MEIQVIRCKFCKKHKLEIEMISGRFNYNFICPRCKKKNIGTIVEKNVKKTGKKHKNEV